MIRSLVSQSIFRDFVSELEGKPVTITDTNFSGLQKVCKEFAFRDLAGKLSNFQPSIGIRAEDAEARGRIAALEEEMEQHGREIAISQAELRQLAADFRRLECEVANLRSEVNDLRTGLRDPVTQQLSIGFTKLRKQIANLKILIATGFRDPVTQQHTTELAELRTELADMKAQIATDLRDPVREQVPVEFAKVRKQVANLKAQIATGLRDPVTQQHTTELAELRTQLSDLKAQIVAKGPDLRFPPSQSASNRFPRLSSHAPPQQPALDSRIISEFPKIFAVFRAKRFKIRWRGSRDGFRANEFHRRCDGRANTLTVILDTEGNIFGGFTPVRWESPVWNGKGGDENNLFKADESLRSFLFTLKNPHNIPARRFALRADRKHQAIHFPRERGPGFGFDIAVLDNCNANTDSWTSLGHSYTNDTGLDGRIVFAGSPNSFQVREIEVFEIAD